MRALRRLAVNAVLALFTMVVIVLAAEAAVRVFVPMAETHIPGNRFNSDGTGFRPGAAWTVSEPEFVEHVRINALGVRDEDIDPKRPVIVFLGDSQTFGTGVEQGERFSDLVRRALAEACGDASLQVLNVAMPGAGSRTELAMLRRLLRNPGLRVSRVFLCITGNDHYANYLDRVAEGTVPQADREVGADVEAPGPGPFWQWVKSVRYRSRLVVFLLQRLEQFQWFRSLYAELKHRAGAGEIDQTGWIYVDGPRLDGWMEATGDYVEELTALGPTTVVLIPDRYRYDPGMRRKAREHLVATGKEPGRIDFSAEARNLSAMCDRLGVPFVDPASSFIAHDDPAALHYAINGHATPLGHAVTAQHLLRHSAFLQKALRTCEGETED